MSQQEYTWLLALSMLVNHRAGNSAIDPEYADPAWTDITAKAGRLTDPSAPSANEAVIAASLFNLVLVFVYCSAINRAKTVNFAPDFCKISLGEISDPIRCIPDYHWIALGIGLALSQCHSDHLPTPAQSTRMPVHHNLCVVWVLFVIVMETESLEQSLSNSVIARSTTAPTTGQPDAIPVHFFPRMSSSEREL